MNILLSEVFAHFICTRPE